MFNSHQILVNHYKNNLLSNLKKEEVEKQAYTNCRVEEDSVIASFWLGTQLGIYPSGKIYSFWTTNQGRADIKRDSAFEDALEEVAEQYGFYVDHQDDSIFFSRVIELPTDLKLLFVSNDQLGSAIELGYVYE